MYDINLHLLVVAVIAGPVLEGLVACKVHSTALIANAVSEQHPLCWR